MSKKKKPETPTDEEIREMKSLSSASVRGQSVDITRIYALYRKYPETFGSISTQEITKAQDEMSSLGGLLGRIK
jgi:hypothetical protein